MVNLREKAYESFKENLLAFNIRPGQFVSQRELVAITSMPLGAIRELIPRLEADGLIKTVPKRGMQIAPVDLNLVQNAYQLRLALEREAVLQFVQTASDRDIEHLAARHEAIIKRASNGAISQKLLDDAQNVDWNLHDTMVDALGNDIISKTYRVNSIKMRLIRFDRILMSSDRVVPAMEEHMAIIDGLRKRDSRRAVSALEAHIESSRRRAIGA